MCECISAPPTFDLPPPPDPSLLWSQLIDDDENSGKYDNIKAISNFYQNFEPETTCQYLDEVSTNLFGFVDSLADGKFWKQLFNGQENENVNVFYYVLTFLFLVLFVGCLIATFLLRIRSNKMRLKSSQRSSPSLNSSKLSTETVGTATATMIASVGSSNRNGTNNVATSINNNGCKISQMYPSATISRRTFTAPKSHYYLQQHLCQHSNNTMRLYESKCNCCNCVNVGCYATAIIGSDNLDSQQQQRIFNSKSATNIFSNGCLSQQLPSHHLQCTLSNNKVHLPQFNHHQHCDDGTLMKNSPRCAALRIQKCSPQMSYITHPSAMITCQNYGAYEQVSSYPNQGYSTMPYDYEEIPIPLSQQHKQQNFYHRTNACDDDTETSTTVFEDLNENLKQFDAIEQQHRLPPPISKPPPIPSKRFVVPQIPPPPLRQDLLSQKFNHLQTDSDSLQTYNTNMSVINDFNIINKRLSNVSSKSAESSAATFDADFQHLASTQSYDKNNAQKNFNHLKDDQNNYDRTCDDATSLTISQLSTDEKAENKRTSLLSPNNIDTKLDHGASSSSANSCQNGRESGYGTGGKNKYLLSQPSPLQTQPIISPAPRFTAFAQRDSLKFIGQNLVTGLDENFTFNNTTLNHQQPHPSMTYV